jgi:hypothetical protein
MLINLVIRTRTHYFRHAYHPTCDTIGRSFDVLGTVIMNDMDLKRFRNLNLPIECENYFFVREFY